MNKILFCLLSLSTLFVKTSAHAELVYPPPRRSQYSKYYMDNDLVDYNIQAPLTAFGYTFPCKGFPEGPATVQIVDSYTVNIKIDGTALHNGGHCQFGITFDDKNFVVLKQVIKHCLVPDGLYYNFKLPEGIPDGKLTVFWTWINAIGNREYYMDCADISIKNGNSPNPDFVIEGKELVIANLPDYKTIPEFPYPDMYDGSDMLYNAKDITLKYEHPTNTNIKTTTEHSTNTNIKTTTEYPTNTNIKTTTEQSTNTNIKTTTEQPTTTNNIDYITKPYITNGIDNKQFALCLNIINLFNFTLIFYGIMS